MVASNPFPLTQESFQTCWDYVDTRYRSARRQTVVAKIGGFVVALFFFLCLIFSGCGLIQKHMEGRFCDFWETTFLFPYWQKVAALLLKPDSTVLVDVITVLLASYTLSAVLFTAIAALVWLLYHPRKALLPTGTYAENTAALAKLAQKGKDETFKSRLTTSVIASVLAIMVIVLILFCYLVITMDAEGVQALLSRFPTADYSINCVIYVLILYCICSILCSVLLFVTRPLYRCRFSFDLVVQCQLGSILAQEAESGVTDEAMEGRIKELIQTISQEALDWEMAGAYAKAREVIFKAAVLGDVPAMEDYARLCLLSRMNDSARYWLKKATATREASTKAKWMLLRLRLGMRHNVSYRQAEKAPLTTIQKVWNGTKLTLSIFWKLFWFAMLIGSVLLIVAMFRASTDPVYNAEFSAAIVEFASHFNIPVE